MSDKILIVDDSRMDRELAAEVLEKRGYQVVTLVDGKQTLGAITTHHPRLVLLDITMPEIDGTAVLQNIRKHWSQIELPVIMVTARSESSDIIDALTLGANDFITKPIEFDIALMRIETQLTISRLSCQAARVREIEAITAMITTYHHEINNPLTIALACLHALKMNHPTEPKLLTAETSLLRIADIVKNTGEVLKRGSVEFDRYLEATRLLRLTRNAAGDRREDEPPSQSPPQAE